MTKLPKILLGVFIVAWLILALNTPYRFVWFTENIVIFIGLPFVILSYFKFRLSNFSYFLIFLLGFIHIAAAHYGYWNTPWGNWLKDVFDSERNQFDRIVHFLFGLLMAPVAFEILKRKLSANKLLAAALSLCVIVAIGALYEIGEYLVGIWTRPEIGMNFLGFQGDIWDTQKDMMLQVLGAFIILPILLLKGIEFRSGRD